MIGTDEVSEIATEVWASLLERDLVPAVRPPLSM